MTTSNTLNPQRTSDLQTAAGDNTIVAGRIPTIHDIVSGAQRAGADISHNAHRLSSWYNNLGFAERAVLGMIPFAGDSIDLGIQAYRLATGKGVDPVVVVLSSLGLAADAAAAATFGGLEGLNASLAVVKASYQTMSQVGKAGLKAIFETASHSPAAMRGLRDLIPELASLAGSGKLAKLLEDPKYVKFVKAKILKQATDKFEKPLKDKSRIGGSKDNEKVSTNYNSSDSLAQQRFDAIAVDLKKQNIPVTEENVANVLGRTNLSSENIEGVLEVAKLEAAKQSDMGRLQMVPG